MTEFSCDGLDGCWHLHYYFKWRGPAYREYLSTQMMDFKDGRRLQIQAYAKFAGINFQTANLQFDYVVRVLGSDELKPEKSRLIRVAKAIAEVTQAVYIPHLLMKTRPTKSIKSMGPEDREIELHGAYAINEQHDLTNKSVLIVDDVFTFGTTLKEIARAIHEYSPTTKVYGFCLAHTMDQDYYKNQAEWTTEYNKVLFGLA